MASLLWLLALTISAHCALQAARQESGGPCSTSLDCQLNGACTDGACVCNPGWTNTDCSVLDLLPVAAQNGFGHLGSNVSSWGAGAVHDPISGQYFMFVDQINMHCGLQEWSRNSRCVLAQSQSPAGPYTLVKVLMDSFCHGSSLSRDPISGRWVFNHMASGSPTTSCAICTDGITPTNSTLGPCVAEGEVPYTQNAFISSSPLGPYQIAPNLKNGANCESFFTPAGALYVACPWSGRVPIPNCDGHNNFLTVFKAKSLDAGLAGAWEQLPLSYSLAGTNTSSICFNWEDQNIWMDRQGNFHTLMHAFRGENTTYPSPGCYYNGTSADWEPAGCTSMGGHAFSSDGSHWYISPVPVYTSTVTFADGNVTHFRARERPHVILSEIGDLMYFISAVGDPGPGGNVGVPGRDHTFTLVQQFAS